MGSGVLSIRGFVPYVLVVFLNAFTDLGHKIIIQNTIFKIYDGETQIVLTAIVNALILLPFIMLFSPSGFIGDRYSKSLIMRLLAGVAVVITLLITLCYYLGLFELAFGLTFVLAVQSAIYSPAKYGYIKELVGNRDITMANGVVQAVTTISILSGILVYSIFFESYLDGASYSSSSDILQHIAPIGWILVASCVVEFILAFRLPDTHVESLKRFHVDRYFKGEYLKENISLLRRDSIILYSILGLSLFWGISQVVLSSFPEYAKNSIGITNTVLVQGMMAIAGIGIVVGSIVAGRVSKNYIEMGTIPLGAIGISVSLLMLPIIVEPIWHMVNFFMFGISSGLFIVPLNSLIQYHSREHELGMILAGNNFMQNVVMFGFLMMTVAFALLGLKGVGLFYLMLIFSTIATIYLIMKMPHILVKFIIFLITSIGYRVKILNLDRLPKSGAVLLLGNHISWIDWVLIQMTTPRPIRFVMDRAIYNRWYLKPFFEMFGAIPISPRAMKQAKIDVGRLLDSGEVVCLFPEGTISRNALLSEFKRGFEKMVEGSSGGVIVPFYLQGMWGDRLSRSSTRLKKLRHKRRYGVIVNFGDPISIKSSASEVKRAIYHLSYQAWLEYTESLPTIPKVWIDSAKRDPRSKCCREFDGRSINYIDMLRESILYSKRLKRDEKRIGIILPPSIEGATVTLASLMADMEVMPLDYRVSQEQFDKIIEKSQIQTIYTTKNFTTKQRAKGIDLDTLLSDIDVVYMEDISVEIGRFERFVVGVIVRLLPKSILKSIYAPKQNNQNVAIDIMSRSRSIEPKIVMLTHSNILANSIQLHDLLNPDESDLLLSTMPLYHAYGMIVGTLSPILMGLGVGFYPEAKRAKGVGRAALRFGATILPSTPEILDLYAHSDTIDPLMFGSLRKVLSGGRKLSDSTQELFEKRYRVEILEGYGATESAPLASINIPNIMESMEFTIQVGEKRGTVGMPLPGTVFDIVDPATMISLDYDQKGLILIGGAQIMKGYLSDPILSDEVIIHRDGLRWFKSGDIGSLDRDGFLTIYSKEEEI
jgi:acyl-[acyl-carrier-protein]-phospholipid O-acyltransferase/long-chain-fatty-acid--[acyl-carrier-protein] ligase